MSPPEQPSEQPGWIRAPRCELGLLLLLLLLVIVDLQHANGSVFAGDDGKYLGWVRAQVEAGNLQPFATHTSAVIGLMLGGGSSLLLLLPLSLGAPLLETAQVASALASVFTLWLLFDLGRLLDSRAAGLVAVVVYLPLQNTDLRTRELVFFVPLLLLCLNLGVRLMRGKGDAGYVWLSAAFGLLVSTHYQGLLLTLATLAALLVAFRAAPPVRPATLLAVITVVILFAASAVMALSRVPLWAIYGLLLGALVWPRLPHAGRAFPVLLIATLGASLAVAPGAIAAGAASLLRPIGRGDLGALCLALGAVSWLAMFTTWARARFARAGSADAVLVSWLLVVLLVGSAVLELAFAITWRHYFWRPTHAVLSLSAGIMLVRMGASWTVGVTSRRAALALATCATLLSATEAVSRRVVRPNPADEMTLGETRSVVDSLVALDGSPEVKDHVSKFQRNAPQLSLLYQLTEEPISTPDRNLVAYLERADGDFARSMQERPWLLRRRIGDTLLFWFKEDPQVGPAPRISLATRGTGGGRRP